MRMYLYEVFVFIICYPQIFDVFDVKRNGVIEFGEFVRSLGVFHPNAPVHEKIKCNLLHNHSTLGTYYSLYLLS